MAAHGAQSPVCILTVCVMLLCGISFVAEYPPLCFKVVATKGSELDLNEFLMPAL